MVRKYRRKRDKYPWNDGQMQLAIDNVRSGKSIASSAKEFGIPRTTLQLKVKEVQQGISTDSSYRKGNSKNNY